MLVMAKLQNVEAWAPWAPCFLRKRATTLRIGFTAFPTKKIEWVKVPAPIFLGGELWEDT